MPCPFDVYVFFFLCHPVFLCFFCPDNNILKSVLKSEWFRETLVCNVCFFTALAKTCRHNICSLWCLTLVHMLVSHSNVLLDFLDFLSLKIFSLMIVINGSKCRAVLSFQRWKIKCFLFHVDWFSWGLLRLYVYLFVFQIWAKRVFQRRRYPEPQD